MERIKREEGWCYYIRFQHTSVNGEVSRQRIRVGLEKDFPSKSAALRAARAIADEFNAQPAAVLGEKRRFQSVIDRYRKEEIPSNYSTRLNYENLLNNHIAPRWGDKFIADIKPLQVREWLRSLKIAGKSRGHIHGMMRILYRFAMLWDWVAQGENPMSLFRLEGSTKRQREPNVLSLEQFIQLVGALDKPQYRAMVLIAGCTGLRRSEIFALKWKDIAYNDLTLRVERAIVDQVTGDVKTIHSKKLLPIDPLLASELLDLHRGTEFPNEDDWIFASPWLGGEMPYRGGNVQRRILIPLGKKIGLAFSLGWHVFRHSYKSWLDERDVPLTVQRDLMRHADVGTTAQVYGSVSANRLRSANSGLVRGLMGKGSK